MIQYKKIEAKLISIFIWTYTRSHRDTYILITIVSRTISFNTLVAVLISMIKIFNQHRQFSINRKQEHKQ